MMGMLIVDDLLFPAEAGRSRMRARPLCGSQRSADQPARPYRSQLSGQAVPRSGSDALDLSPFYGAGLVVLGLVTCILTLSLWLPSAFR